MSPRAHPVNVNVPLVVPAALKAETVERVNAAVPYDTFVIVGPADPPISRLPTVAVAVTLSVPIVDVLTISVPIVAVPVDAVMFDPNVTAPRMVGIVAVEMVAVPAERVPIVAVPVDAVILEPNVIAPS